jgi:hypothetical protein
MRDNLHLTPIDLLTPITPEDSEFANKVSIEYNLPFDEICWLIRDVRDTLKDGFSEFKENSRLKDTFDKLFARDVEIKGICINTNKGTIDIKTSDSIYEVYFRKQVQKIRRDFKDTLNLESDFLTSISKHSAFAKILIYFMGAHLIDYKRNNAIFDFIIKLSLGNPVMTEEEWVKDPTSDKDYKHYKNKIIRSRIKGYLKDLNS